MKLLFLSFVYFFVIFNKENNLTIINNKKNNPDKDKLDK